ncbi:MAG: hypothetical protein K2M06_04095 [Muribaculaceae bacterium]|nr:hypothetical protein [Muribaculaceae bacterium]
MKALYAISAPEVRHRQSVKKLLIQVIICLTSEFFLTFATVTGCLIEIAGVAGGNDRAIIYGAAVFLAGFMPWSLRLTHRVNRNGKPGLKK